MTETITLGCDNREKWLWANIIDDLEKQGGLDIGTFAIDPLSFDNENTCEGNYKDIRFLMSWLKDHFLMITVNKINDDTKLLIAAFTKVINYEPFIMYNHHDNKLFTYEWDKDDPIDRFISIEAMKPSSIEVLEGMPCRHGKCIDCKYMIWTNPNPKDCECKQLKNYKTRNALNSCFCKYFNVKKVK